MLKDKGRSLLKAYDGYNRCKVGHNKPFDDSFRIEGQYELVHDLVNPKQSLFIETWQIEVSTLVGFRETDFGTMWDVFSYSYRDAFFYNGGWYDDYSYELIVGNSIKKLNFRYKEEMFIGPGKPERVNWWTDISSKETIFIYNKPLPDWRRWRLYNDGKRRKSCKKMANSTDRALAREWISRGDFDAPVGTHACSKSIAWCVS